MPTIRTGVRLVDPRRGEYRCNACGAIWLLSERRDVAYERFRCPQGCGTSAALEKMTERLARVAKEKP